jgi:hypothetical protein
MACQLCVSLSYQYGVARRRRELHEALRPLAEQRALARAHVDQVLVRPARRVPRRLDRVRLRCTADGHVGVAARADVHRPACPGPQAGPRGRRAGAPRPRTRRRSCCMRRSCTGWICGSCQCQTSTRTRSSGSRPSSAASERARRRAEEDALAVAREAHVAVLADPPAVRYRPRCLPPPAGALTAGAAASGRARVLAALHPIAPRSTGTPAARPPHRTPAAHTRPRRCAL